MLTDVINKAKNFSDLNNHYFKFMYWSHAVIDGWSWLSSMWRLRNSASIHLVAPPPPRALKYFASSQGMGKRKTRNAHLLPNYFILERTQVYLLIFHWREWAICYHKDLGRKGRTNFDAQLSVLPFMPWSTKNISEYSSSYPWNKFLTSSIQKIWGMHNSPSGIDTTSPVTMFVSWSRSNHWPKYWPLLGSTSFTMYLCSVHSLWMKCCSHPLTMSPTIWVALSNRIIVDKI